MKSQTWSIQKLSCSIIGRKAAGSIIAATARAIAAQAEMVGLFGNVPRPAVYGAKGIAIGDGFAKRHRPYDPRVYQIDPRVW